MEVPLFDIQAGFGGRTPGSPTVFSAGDLSAEMARLFIEGALVRIAPVEMDYDLMLSNGTLFDGCRRNAHLSPCPAIVPGDESGATVDEDRKVSDLIAQGAAAVCIRPAHDKWMLAEWCCGRLMAALARRRLPVVCQIDHVSYGEAASVAAGHPDLPVLLIGVDFRSARILLPMMGRFPNVYLSVGSGFTCHCGIETFVRHLGPDRLLFGTGMPAAEPMMAVTQLMYANISDSDKRQVGAGNWRRLLEGIAR